MSDDGKGDYKLISVVDCDPRYDNIHELDTSSRDGHHFAGTL